MSLIASRSVLAAVLSFGTASPVLALDVHTVAADGQSDFTTIQAAVDAAVNGDVVLVRGGSYPAFTVDGKSLWISRIGTNDARTGSIVVKNLAPDQRVVLCRLDVTGSSPSTPALHVIDNLGHVRAIDCEISGRDGVSLLAGGTGIEIQDSRAVTLDGCSIAGGRGGDAFFNPAGNGGPGLVSDRSTPALYRCNVRGGSGGSVDLFPGPVGQGGTACHVKSRSVFLSAATIVGGQGGGAGSRSEGAAGADGGTGLVVDAVAGAVLLGSSVSGGAGGISFWGSHGAPGPATSGTGTITDLLETPRLVRAELVNSQSQLVELEITGSPGDRVYFGMSMSPGFTPAPAALGYDLLAPSARFNRHPIGTIPSSGALKVQVSMPAIGAESMRPLFGQAFVVDVDGRTVRSGPVHFLVANCAMIAPDCNGNGSWDFCDLADGTSIDSDGNDVADECEFTQITHVDASAAIGGDGSAAHPFRTIQQGVNASPNLWVVRVHDGLYTGAQNRNINLSGRSLRVESANGPANCILDLEDAGIAFASMFGEVFPPSRIAGFTIRNGNAAGFSFGSKPAFAGGIHVLSSNPMIEDCTFENCHGPAAGAIFGRFMNSRIRGCRFVGNQSPASGAISLVAAFTPATGAAEIVDCYFLGNVGGQGGGAVQLTASNGNEARMTHCIVLSNSATLSGGIYVRTETVPEQAVRIENCLIAGNTAPSGAGVHFNNSLGSNPANVLRNCTIVGNVATSQGGGVRARSATLENCVVWGNSASSGAQLSVPGNGTLTVQRCDVEGGQVGVQVGPGAQLTWSAGNIDIDPLFVDPDGLDNTLATFRDNDYRLGMSSPCIDAGDNALVPLDFFDLDGDSITAEPVPFDLAFLPRIIGAFVDMGAYEKQP